MNEWSSFMNAQLDRIILSEEEIQNRVSSIAREVTEHYAALGVHEVVIIGILRGAVLFMGDLIRQLPLSVSIDFMAISSYGDSTASSGTVRIIKDISEDIFGKHVLVIEDIVDTGLTLKNLLSVLQARNPQSLSTCTLLNKPSRRKTQVQPDFCGFEIPDEFVVGYGLDFAGHYRHLPYIGVLKPEVYKQS